MKVHVATIADFYFAMTATVYTTIENFLLFKLTSACFFNHLIIYPLKVNKSAATFSLEHKLMLIDHPALKDVIRRFEICEQKYLSHINIIHLFLPNF